MYPTALECGIDHIRFWEMSLREITDIMEDYARKKERREKEELYQIHFLAKDMANQVGFILAGDESATAPELWDYFPGLFALEKDAAEQKKKECALAVYKAQMTDFMYRHNHALEGGEE